jgi:diguanylate cyclase (GGDEF)-like protein
MPFASKALLMYPFSPVGNGDDMERPSRILLVEDSRSFAGLAAHAVQSRLGIPVSIAQTLAEAGRVLDGAGDSPVLVVTGLSLADGRDVDAVRFFTERDKPVIVLTGTFDEAKRQRILDMPVVDYVLKDSPTCIDYLVDLIRRLERNRHYTALVVDDSKAIRQQMAGLLALHRFHVLEASDGAEGLQLLAAHPAIRLVVTDFAMPVMDGVEMVRRIRQNRGKDELAIVGVSGSDSFTSKGLLSARFLKNGANDFLVKPFEREEFHCRIEHNVGALETMAKLRDMATKDFLTGLPNRRHFFAMAEPLFARGANLCAAMLDIDFFKKINDTYGHDAGDEVLRVVARTVADRVQSNDLVARFGGEEFCILAKDMTPAEATLFFEGIRGAIAALTIEAGGAKVVISASIGIARTPAPTLDTLLASADCALYRAKGGGRNRVEFA